jgi:hypothetical protein
MPDSDSTVLRAVIRDYQHKSYGNHQMARRHAVNISSTERRVQTHHDGETEHPKKSTDNSVTNAQLSSETAEIQPF